MRPEKHAKWRKNRIIYKLNDTGYIKFDFL